MVFTRSKARQKTIENAQLVECESDAPQRMLETVQNVRPVKKTRKSVSQVCSTEQACSEGDERKESLEKLALRALQVMKDRLGIEDSNQTGMETSNSTQPDVMTLESDSNSKKTTPIKSHRPDMLASSLKPCMKETPYFSFSRKRGLSQSARKPAVSLLWGQSEDDIMKKSVITSDFEKRDVAPPMYVSKFSKAKARKEAMERSAGGGWYGMQAPQMTTELQNDLKLLRMRNALDPSQHYKASDWKKLPRYFQVGKVVSGPAEFYSSRITKRQRKRTIMDELLHNHQFRRYQKKKYSELQRIFRSGTRRKRFIKHKKHYKK